MSKESQRIFCFMIGPWGDLVRVMMVLTSWLKGPCGANVSKGYRGSGEWWSRVP